MKFPNLIPALILYTCAALGLAVVAQTPSAPKTFDVVTKAKPDPNVLTLPPDDQKQLDLINDRIVQMKPQLEAAQKQRDDAQSRLNEANSFIAQYNTIDAARMAFLFRIAADVCGCKTTDLEFSVDGKSVVKRKPAVSSIVTAPNTSELNAKPKQ